MKKRVYAALMAVVLSASMFMGMPVTAHAEHMPYFLFYQEYLPNFGYEDNLFMVMYSPGEFNAEDVLWMAQHDCFDEEGLAWCVGAGLMDAETYQKMLPLVSHKKPKTVF